MLPEKQNLICLSAVNKKIGDRALCFKGFVIRMHLKTQTEAGSNGDV
jgi:hypothetical protein